MKTGGLQLEKGESIIRHSTWAGPTETGLSRIWGLNLNKTGICSRAQSKLVLLRTPWSLHEGRMETVQK